MIIDVSAAWCLACRQMEREVHPNAEFIEFSKSQVFMLVDEADPEGMRIAGRFRVQSYPTILVLNSKGDEIDRLVGGRDARTLISDLKKLLAHPVPYGEAVKQASARPDDFEVQYSTGNRALDRGDYQRARQFLARASSLSAGRSMEERTLTLAYLSTACFRDGKYQDSLNALDALDRLDPKLAESVPELKLQRVRALVSLKKYDEAYAVLGDYLRGSHSRSEADGARKILAELPGKYRRGDRDYTAAIDKAKENLRKGNADAALEFASKAAELAPQAAEAHFILAATHFSVSSRESDTQRKSERLSTGLHELRLARRLDPEDLGTFQNARRHIASAYIPHEPGSPEAKKSYAEAEQRFAEARYDDAAKAYLRVIKTEPRFGKAYLHLGDCFFTAGSLEEAMKYYRLASSVTPLDASTYRFTADTLLRLGKAEEAREYIFQSVLADPEYPFAWKNLEQDARSRGLNMERHTHIVPHQFLGLDESRYDEKLFDNVPPETVAAWREYVKTKLLWRGSKFAAAFPKEQFYHTSFPEEFEALQELVKAWSALKETNPDLRERESRLRPPGGDRRDARRSRVPRTLHRGIPPAVRGLEDEEPRHGACLSERLYSERGAGQVARGVQQLGR